MGKVAYDLITKEMTISKPEYLVNNKNGLIVSLSKIIILKKMKKYFFFTLFAIFSFLLLRDI